MRKNKINERKNNSKSLKETSYNSSEDLVVTLKKNSNDLFCIWCENIVCNPEIVRFKITPSESDKYNSLIVCRKCKNEISKLELATVSYGDITYILTTAENVT